MDPSAVDRSDPAAPLAGAPDPWDFMPQPSRRDRPPYHMTDMIAAEPALARRLLARLADRGGSAGRVAAAIREVSMAGQPILATGCGTSEHGALAFADIMRDGLRRAGLASSAAQPTAVQAFELSLDPPRAGLVVGVSHEGGTWATNRALEAARAAGARVAAITGSHRSPAALIGEPELVIATDELDQSWCHTIGYVSPVLAASAVRAHLTGEHLDVEAVAQAFEAGVAHLPALERLAASLAEASRIVVVASGSDRTAGRELALKIEEGSWVATAYRDLETILHGHLPATDATTGLVLLLADREGRRERVARARQALEAAAVIGLRSGAILAAEADDALAGAPLPAGRIVVPEAPALPAPIAALIGSATALQLLTERLARARGTDPDPIRRDDPVYREAAALVGG